MHGRHLCSIYGNDQISFATWHKDGHFSQRSPVVEQLRISVALTQDPERRETHGGCDRIAAQGPYLGQEAVLARHVAI